MHTSENMRINARNRDLRFFFSLSPLLRFRAPQKNEEGERKKGGSEHTCVSLLSTKIKRAAKVDREMRLFSSFLFSPFFATGVWERGGVDTHKKGGVINCLAKRPTATATAETLLLPPFSALFPFSFCVFANDSLPVWWPSGGERNCGSQGGRPAGKERGRFEMKKSH